MEAIEFVAPCAFICVIGLVVVGCTFGIFSSFDTGPWTHTDPNIEGLTYTVYDNGNLMIVYTPTGDETAFDVTTFRERGWGGSEKQVICHIDNPREQLRVNSVPASSNHYQLYTIVVSRPSGSTQTSIWNSHN